MPQTMFMRIPSAAAIFGSIVPLLLLATIAVILRFYTRSKLRQPFSVDDWLTVPALVFTFGLTSIMFYGISTKTLAYPLDENSDILNGWTVVTARKLEYSFIPIFAFTNGLVKLSVLFLYRRIFVVDKSWRDPRSAFFLAFMTIIGTWAIVCALIIAMPCLPDVRVYFVNPEAWAYECIDTFKFGYAFAISDFITDCLVILVPIPFICRLRLPTARKLAVISVFCLGIIVCAASLIRLIWMIWALHMGADDSTDEELMLTQELYWCLVEITIGLVASCLPTLRGLLKTKSVDSVVRSFRSLLSLRSGSFSTLEKSNDSSESMGSRGKVSGKRSTGEPTSVTGSNERDDDSTKQMV